MAWSWLLLLTIEFESISLAASDSLPQFKIGCVKKIVSHLILDFLIRSHADDRKTPLGQPPIGRDTDSLLCLFAVLADSTLNESPRRPTFFHGECFEVF